MRCPGRALLQASPGLVPANWGALGLAKGEPSCQACSRLPSPGTAGPRPPSSGRATQLPKMKSELMALRF